jgi:hypothetical protein
VLEQHSQYGQLQHIFTLPLAPRTRINPQHEPRTLLLAWILDADTTQEDTYQYPVVWYEGELGTGEVVDANTIQCAVGRVRDGNRWWIIDRSSALAYPVFV